MVVYADVLVVLCRRKPPETSMPKLWQFLAWVRVTSMRSRLTLSRPRPASTFLGCTFGSSRCVAIPSGTSVTAGRRDVRCSGYGAESNRSWIAARFPRSKRSWANSTRFSGAGSIASTGSPPLSIFGMWVRMSRSSSDDGCRRSISAAGGRFRRRLRPAGGGLACISCRAALRTRAECRRMKVPGEPDEGKLHVRFDEGVLETRLGNRLRHRR